MKEPREYIDDIFEQPQLGWLARQLERVMTRYYMWRVARRFRVMR